MFSCCRYRGSYRSAPLVADIEGLTGVLLLLQMRRVLHECSSFCKFRGSYISASLAAYKEDLT